MYISHNGLTLWNLDHNGLTLWDLSYAGDHLVVALLGSLLHPAALWRGKKGKYLLILLGKYMFYASFSSIGIYSSDLFKVLRLNDY